MIGLAGLVYGIALSVTLSMLGRNARERRRSPLLLVGLGYLLCGVSAGLSGALALVALSGEAAATSLSPLLI